jgi:hypothetical protein
VPGLEPIYQKYTNGHESIPALPRNYDYKQWTASNMYYKHGIEVKREGKFECDWKDESKWDRLIWSAPDAKYLAARKAETIAAKETEFIATKGSEAFDEPEDHIPYRSEDIQNPSFLRGNGYVPVIDWADQVSRMRADTTASLQTLSRTSDPASSPLTLALKNDPEAEQPRDGPTRED